MVNRQLSKKGNWCVELIEVSRVFLFVSVQ